MNELDTEATRGRAARFREAGFRPLADELDALCGEVDALRAENTTLREILSAVSVADDIIARYRAAPLPVPHPRRDDVQLFDGTPFISHSGLPLDFKIECDALTNDEVATLAREIARAVPPFSRVEGVPRGGLRIADALKQYRLMPVSSVEPGRLLIVDDVCTTGRSMEEHRAGRDAIGAVIFARGEYPSWVTPLFVMVGASTGTPKEDARD